MIWRPGEHDTSKCKGPACGTLLPSAMCLFGNSSNMWVAGAVCEAEGGGVNGRLSQSQPNTRTLQYHEAIQQLTPGYGSPGPRTSLTPSCHTHADLMYKVHYKVPPPPPGDEQ